MKRNLLPIKILILYLILLMLIGSLSQAGLSLSVWFTQFRNFALVLGGAQAVYSLLLFLKKTKPTIFDHRLITCAILFLLFYSDNPWYFFFGLGVSVELLQRFIRLPTGPVVNPAGFVVLIATLMGYYPVWWGASFAPRTPLSFGGISVAVLFTIPFGLYVAYKYRKLKIIFSLLLAFALSYLFISQHSPLFIITEGTFLFFALVMAIEPKTSPVIRNEQIVYGVTLGILVTLANIINFPETFVGPLVLCNIIFNMYRNRKFLATKFRRSSVPTSPVVTGSATISQ
ncbi:MAG: RnfABCDGE type electron transport complex subunit D [Patescibacteria group bacterium]